MQKEEIKFQDSSIFEGMTSIRAIINGNTNGINDRKIKRIIFDSARMNKNRKTIDYLRKMASVLNFSVEESNKENIDKLALGSSHGGIIAECDDRHIDQLSESIEKIKQVGFYVMIQGIEDPYNFGYSIRSLYALGVDGIILPPRNWLSAAGVVARSSAGASEMVEMFESEPENAADLFHTLGYTVVCADEDTDLSICDADLRFPVFLIVGGEKRGISQGLLQKCDKIVKINYGRSFSASLSAASAATIIGYEVFRQNSILK